jgi:non-specific protein-tyrosine kinase
LLGSKRMTDLLASLREKYDVVLIDAPPLLPVTDAAVLAPRVDAILVVARYGRTHVQDAVAARDALHTVSGQILGSVLTMARHESSTRQAQLRPAGQRWRRPLRQPQDGKPPEFDVPMVPARTVADAYARPSPYPRPRPRVDAEPDNDDPSERSSTEESLDRGSAAG